MTACDPLCVSVDKRKEGQARRVLSASQQAHTAAIPRVNYPLLWMYQHTESPI